MKIKSTDWIVDSAVIGARKFRPRFSDIYLPHLDYAAQKFGPNSPQAAAALGELDAAIGRLVEGYQAAGIDDTLWLAASEYAIVDVEIGQAAQIDVDTPEAVAAAGGVLRA